MYDFWEASRFDSVVLGYVSTSAGGNINFVELVREQSILYDWQGPGYTRKDKS
jgi:hypothetical protein